MSMHLKLMLPTEIMVDETVSKIIAEGREGSFCIKPRHTDYVAVLVPGLLIFVSESGSENYLATDEGCLVKTGREVLVSTRHAVKGENLAELRVLMEARFHDLDEHARKARVALAGLELGVVRKFIELQEASQ